MPYRFTTLSLLSLALLFTGCENPPAEKLAGGYDAGLMAQRIDESMAQLSPEDRKAAEAQKFCPVGVEFDDDGKPVSGLLGSIGKPVKMTVKDQSVFIMCPNCKEDFNENTDKYMAVLTKIRASQDKQ